MIICILWHKNSPSLSTMRKCRGVLITPSCVYLWCKFPPLGRVFKIHDFFLHGFEKNDIVNS